MKKVCARCQSEKPAGEFYKHAQTRDKLSSYCKKCDNTRPRKATGARINRVRARHRAVADLIQMYPQEFDALLAIRLAEATEEAQALATESAAMKHYEPGEPVRLQPGPKMAGQTIGDRIDVARCPHCVKHHDRGHICAACGSSPGAKLTVPSGVRDKSGGIDLEALARFNEGTTRARSTR